MLNPVVDSLRNLNLRNLRRISHELITVVAELQGAEILGVLKLSEDFCERMDTATNWIETEIYLLEEQNPY